MEIRLTIPDTVISALQQQWPEEDILHHILEDLVLKWYQEDVLTAEEVRVALGLATSLQVEVNGHLSCLESGARVSCFPIDAYSWVRMIALDADVVR